MHSAHASPRGTSTTAANCRLLPGARVSTRTSVTARPTGARGGFDGVAGAPDPTTGVGRWVPTQDGRPVVARAVPRLHPPTVAGVDFRPRGANSEPGGDQSEPDSRGPDSTVLGPGLDRSGRLRSTSDNVLGGRPGRLGGPAVRRRTEHRRKAVHSPPDDRAGRRSADVPGPAQAPKRGPASDRVTVAPRSSGRRSKPSSVAGPSPHSLMSITRRDESTLLRNHQDGCVSERHYRTKTGTAQRWVNPRTQSVDHTGVTHHRNATKVVSGKRAGTTICRTHVMAWKPDRHSVDRLRRVLAAVDRPWSASGRVHDRRS